ncbi:MAG: DNA repair protein RadC [Chloroflexota bacterium]|nr:DNA repair protein RadC [Chloroflexota bacterium]
MNKAPTIHDLPAEMRPRERLLHSGAASLTIIELLAVILRTGSNGESVLHLAERVLAQIGGLEGLLNINPANLLQLKGLGETKLAQLLAIGEIARRLQAHTPSERTPIHHAEDAARLLGDMAYLGQEHVRVLLLDQSRRLVAMQTVYIGTLNMSVLRVAEVFREAMVRNCPALILAHNHPSGDPSPSPEDVELTRTLIAAGRLLDIALVDHLIMGRGKWVSLRESGLVF